MLRSFLCAVSVALAFGASCIATQAAIKLPAIISDNMVLQVNQPLYFWGLADPGEYITVLIGEEKFPATADSKGRWMVRTTPMKNGPDEITIHGKSDIVIHNVLWGDNWLCAGQSNMLLSVEKCAHTPADLPETEFNDIRLFQEEPQASKNAEFEGTGKWVVLNPETVRNFSSVGYFFGREIYDKTQTPLGLIQAARSGATLPSWISREALEKSEFKTILPAHDEQFEALDKVKEELDKVDQNENPQKYSRIKYRLDYMNARAQSATSTYNSMISPLVPWSLKGIVWYQGENDLGEPLKWGRMFTVLVQSYRNEFIRPYLPFIYVQMPNALARNSIPEESLYADLREAQANFQKKMPASYMAVAIDTVPGKEAPLHPKDKRVIAHRLANIALVTQYKQAEKFASVRYESMEIQDGKIRIHFVGTDPGLKVKGAELKGFSIAADDRLFEFAKAQIVGNDVLVWSDKVKRPVAVRYAWADNPAANLYGTANLPVIPFRTDVWPRKKKVAQDAMPKEDLNDNMKPPVNEEEPSDEDGQEDQKDLKDQRDQKDQKVQKGQKIQTKRSEQKEENDQ